MNDSIDETLHPLVIKVIGIGGCGINAINCMIENGIRGVEYIAVSYDIQELSRSKTNQSLHLASAQKVPPAIGLSALSITISESDLEQLKGMVSGADIVFIVAGIGSGTGTSIAPITAKIARELGILTIAVVSMPMSFEGNRTHRAEQGIQELSVHADAFIIVSNAMLMTETHMRVSDVFNAANNLMHKAVAGIAESVSSENLISLDINDLLMIFSDVGMIAMGTANASGVDRAKVACVSTMSSIFPSTTNLADARTILISITTSSSLKLPEVTEIIEYVQLAAVDGLVIVAVILDESMGDDICLTLFATGFNR